MKHEITITLNPAYAFLKDFVTRLPECFASEGEIIYNERNVLKRYQVQGVDLIVKSFKVPVLLNKIVYGTFRPSKACRSYTYAQEILRRGGNTPDPIAYIEEFYCGLLCRSFYLCAYQADATTVRGYMNGEITDADDVLRSFIRFTLSIQRAGILQIDYSPGNILLRTGADGSYSFSLIDINRLVFKQLTPDEALRNFDRLALSLAASTRLAELYAEECGLDKALTVCQINDYSDQFFLKRTFRQTLKQIKRDRGSLATFVGPLQHYLLVRALRLLLGSAPDSPLFRRERALYLHHIRPHDERHVLLRRYGY